LIRESPDERWAFARKQTVADLETAGNATQGGHETHRVFTGFDVESD
jgi:hypothetical protein